SSDPVAEVDEAMREVLALFPAPGSSPQPGGGTTVVAFRTAQDIDTLLPSLRRLVEDGAEH
ncbi:TetR family transcriptional regulator, partial [Streptomyces sp. NPDC059474]